MVSTVEKVDCGLYRFSAFSVIIVVLHYTVLGGTLNPTHSLTVFFADFFSHHWIILSVLWKHKLLLCAHAVATKSQSEVTHNFANGDMIEVCEGELIHLQGRVIRIDGNKITMLPKHEDLKVCCQ